MNVSKHPKRPLPGATQSLIGRHVELSALERAVDALDSGSCGVLLVAGEPGIGKTRLLAELCAQGQARGYLMLVGRAAEFERDLPFSVFVAALDDHLASVDPIGLEGIGAQQTAELARLFPTLAQSASEAEPVMLSAERHRVYQATRTLLETLSRARPLVLTLDDLHWADPASVELVLHLLARPLQAPVLLALAYCPAQLPPRLAGALDAVVREGTAERVELGPLSPGEADELIGPGIDRVTRDQLYHHSGGNPFYLEQLVRGTGSHRDVTAPARVSADGVPEAVRKALVSELGHLSAHASAMLRGAAVASDPFEHDLAAHTAALNEAQALPALDELLERDLVRPIGIPGRFRFRHPIVRAAVYSSTGAGWRLGAHARAAVVLAARGATPSARAHHVEHSARAGDEAAIAVLAEAGRTTAPRAPATAARWFAAALRLVTDERATQQRLELLVALATALGSAGQLEDSRLALCQALELLGPAHNALRVHLVALCARVERLLGRHQDAHNRLAQALEGLGDECSPEAAALMLELAVDSLFACDFPSARAQAAQARVVAQGLGDRGLALAATGMLARVDYSLGNTTDAEAYLDEAAALLDGLADSDLAARLDAACYLGWAEHWLERFDDAIRHLKRGIAVSRATGQGHLLVPMMLGACLALSTRGRLAEAGDLADTAVEASRSSGSAQLLSWALWVRSTVATATDDLPAAIAAGQESVELARTLDSFLLSATSASVLAPALLEAGEAERCRTALLAVVGDPDTPLIVPATRCACYALLTHAELALGHIEAAHEWSLRAEATANGLGLPVITGRARRARAAVLLADGQAGPAAQAALAAAEAAEAAGARIEGARSRILAGQALASSGERKAAVTQLERAESELAACGAHRYREQAVRELRRLGRRKRRPRSAGPEAAGPESLTERELEIAELVVTGNTNRAIATNLYISERTVETHLSHIFAKLGVSSRTAMAGIIFHHQQRALDGE